MGQFPKHLASFLAIFISLHLASCSSKSAIDPTDSSNKPLKVGIAPYQEIALLVNEKNLGLEEKYKTKLELITMPWEDLLPATASAGQSIDVGMASMSDYLAKSERLNAEGEDPIIYLYPIWVFHGGGLITFNKDVPEINEKTIKDKAVIKKFLSYKIGVQKNSCCHMMIWKVAKIAGMKLSDVQIVDTTLNDGLLATENGSLDIAGAGLTQRTEAIKRKGRVVLTMDTAGTNDPGGFVCKESVYKNRKREIDSLVRIWFDCTNYVLSDIDKNSGDTLKYLEANAATKYTLSEFKSALAQEYVPTSISEMQKNVVEGDGKYSIAQAVKLINEYLLDIGVSKTPVKAPKVISIAQ